MSKPKNQKLPRNPLSDRLSNFKIYLFNFIILVINTYKDGQLFFKHSMVFKQDTFNKIESRIILHYHGLEKGFLYKDIKYRFGENRVKELIKLLKQEKVIVNHKRSQIAAAYLVICTYYEKHQITGIDISDYYSIEDYTFLKSYSTLSSNVIKTHYIEQFFEKSESNFAEFAQSRASVRNFTGQKISFATIAMAIDLAKTAPSVCNRQATRVYYVDDKNSIDRILAIQQGLTGYTNEIAQLLILVADRNYFYSIGERNQLYIDGGIFLMNLLYSLHHLKIAACPAHWGFNYKQDKKIQMVLNLKDSEKVICIIPIGIPNEIFNTTLSLRRNQDEILNVVNADSTI